MGGGAEGGLIEEFAVLGVRPVVNLRPVLLVPLGDPGARIGNRGFEYLHQGTGATLGERSNDPSPRRDANTLTLGRQQNVSGVRHAEHRRQRRGVGIMNQTRTRSGVVVET